MKKQFKIDDEYINKIISVAYGDGNLFDKIDVYIKAFSNKSVKNILTEYKTTSKAVKMLSQDFKSNDLSKNIGHEIHYKNSSSVTLFALLYKIFISKPLYTAAGVIVVLGVSSLFLLHKPEVKPAYTKEQVAAAELQVKQSFALVGKILDKTQYKITNEIIGKDVVKPIHKGTAAINNLFNGG